MNMSPAEMQKERMKYEMPEVSQGQVIAWIPNVRQPHRTHLAFVESPKDRNVGMIDSVFVPARMQGQIIFSVPHITDPALKLGTAYHENGAWDFVEADKDTRTDGPSYEEMLEAAKAKGFESVGRGRPKKTELVEYLAEHE